MKVLIIGGSLPAQYRNGHDRVDGYSRAVWQIAKTVASDGQAEVTMIPYHFTESLQVQGVQVLRVQPDCALGSISGAGIRSISCMLRYVPAARRFDFGLKNVLIRGTVLRALKNEHFDVIHVHGVTPMFQAFSDVVLGAGVPVLLTLHGLYSTDPNIHPGFDTRFEPDMCLNYLSAGATISTVSEYTARGLEELLCLQQGAVLVAENSVDDLYLQGDASTRTTNRLAIRKLLGLNDRDVIALTVGSISVRKNQVAIVRALATRGDRRLHYCLVGAGDPADVLKAALECGVQDQVHIAGTKSTQELIMYYDAADFLVHCPTSEGFGLAMAESLTRGRPVVSVRSLPFARLYLNETNSVLVDDASTNAVATGLTQAIASIQAGAFSPLTIQETARRQFSSARMGHEYVALYNVVTHGCKSQES